MVNYPIRQLSSFLAFNTLIVANPKKKKKKENENLLRLANTTRAQKDKHKVESYELLFPEIKYITKTFLHH